MTIERVWPGTILGTLIIIAAAVAIAFALYWAVPVGRVLWEGRHYDCLAPSGDCARAR